MIRVHLVRNRWSRRGSSEGRRPSRQRGTNLDEGMSRFGRACSYSRRRWSQLLVWALMKRQERQAELCGMWVETWSKAARVLQVEVGARMLLL